ncbi:hypothetical protein DH2020_014301 [Rehmannia glutinosa]|uniref:Uncharacterized protein n=1 Tax=Rehmannia glutinosa TaxID=99300 RepID=A0ABR0WYK4_REHGL
MGLADDVTGVLSGRQANFSLYLVGANLWVWSSDRRPLLILASSGDRGKGIMDPMEENISGSSELERGGVAVETPGVGSVPLAARLPPVNLGVEFASETLQFTREQLGALIEGVVGAALARREGVERVEREAPPLVEGRGPEGEGGVVELVGSLQKEVRELRNTLKEKEPGNIQASRKCYVEAARKGEQKKTKRKVVELDRETKPIKIRKKKKEEDPDCIRVEAEEER